MFSTPETSVHVLDKNREISLLERERERERESVCVASPSRRDAGFTIRLNDGKNQSLYFINFITK